MAKRKPKDLSPETLDTLLVLFRAITFRREELGMTQTQFHEKSGMTRATISRLDSSSRSSANGGAINPAATNLQLSSIVALARGLDMSFFELTRWAHDDEERIRQRFSAGEYLGNWEAINNLLTENRRLREQLEQLETG